MTVSRFSVPAGAPALRRGEPVLVPVVSLYRRAARHGTVAATPV